MNAEDLVCESEICVGVLGNGPEVVLVPLGEDYEGAQETVQDAIARGLVYCGALGWGKGKMRVALEPDSETLTPMRFAALAFGEMVGRMIAPPAPDAENSHQGDTADWLSALWALPDPRTN